MGLEVTDKDQSRVVVNGGDEAVIVALDVENVVFSSHVHGIDGLAEVVQGIEISGLHQFLPNQEPLLGIGVLFNELSQTGRFDDPHSDEDLDGGVESFCQSLRHFEIDATFSVKNFGNDPLGADFIF